MLQQATYKLEGLVCVWVSVCACMCDILHQEVWVSVCACMCDILHQEVWTAGHETTCMHTCELKLGLSSSCPFCRIVVMCLSIVYMVRQKRIHSIIHLSEQSPPHL